MGLGTAGHEERATVGSRLHGDLGSADLLGTFHDLGLVASDEGPVHGNGNRIVDGCELLEGLRRDLAERFAGHEGIRPLDARKALGDKFTEIALLFPVGGAFTKASADDYTYANRYAEQVYYDENASAEELILAREELQAAFEGLEPFEGDKAELWSLIEQLEAFIDTDEARARDDYEALKDALMAEHLLHIRLDGIGFGPYYKPPGTDLDAVADGHLLIMCPWEHDERRHLGKAEFEELNRIAMLLATEG
jgi:hypothetical protein